MLKLIKKGNIRNLLEEAARQWEVFAPQKNSGGDTWFDRLPKTGKELKAALESISLDEVDTVIAPKEIFFPQLDSLFEFNGEKIRETSVSSPKLLFGIRPCDLKGMLFADDFFRRNFEDKFYLNRIANRFIVAQGCIKPARPSCFCSSAKTGPFNQDGYDLQLIEVGQAYYVQTGTKEGEEFIKRYAEFFADAGPGAEKSIVEIKSAASKALDLKVDFQKALDLMAGKDFVPEENYKRIGERCIYCGACLYSCPTCTCFNVFDNAVDKSGLRMRNWDACIFEGYTRETSGHNPRKEKWQRTSRRYEHKLKYDYKMTGSSGCVGCGRCLSNCPVNIGISKFIQEITENKRIM